MNPFEVERLGWDEIRGLPVVADPEIGTGRFRIVCSREGEGEELEEVEAIGEPIEVGEPEPGWGSPGLALEVRARGRCVSLERLAVQVGEPAGQDQDAHRDQDRAADGDDQPRSGA